MAYSPVYTTTTNVYNKSGLSATEVDLSAKDDIIEDAEKELESLTGRKFTDANAITEVIKAPNKDIFENSSKTLKLNFYPVQSITSFTLLDTEGTVTETYDTLSSAEITAGTYFSDDYWVTTSTDDLSNTIVPNGIVEMISLTFTPKYRLKIAYTYGYSAVPTLIRTLASCLAGIRAWVTFLGGSYNRLDSYSIPQQGVSKGDFYSRGRQMIEHLSQEAKEILDRVGRRRDTIFFASSSNRG